MGFLILFEVYCPRYKKILAAWKEAKPPPSNAEEAARLTVETLKRHHKVDVEVYILQLQALGSSFSLCYSFSIIN